MSESSTATSVPIGSCADLVRLSSSEDTVSQGVIAVADYRRKRIAVVYRAADSWAADASRILSENLRVAGANPSATSACRRTVRAFRGGHRGRTDGDPLRREGGSPRTAPTEFSTN